MKSHTFRSVLLIALAMLAALGCSVLGVPISIQIGATITPANASPTRLAGISAATSVPINTPLLSTMTPVVISTPTPADTTTIFADDFSSCNLPVTDDTNSNTRCANGEYTMLLKSGNASRWVTYVPEYDDMVIEVDAHSVAVSPFGSYGLIWRHSSDSNNYYLLVIGSGGRYGVFRYARPNFVPLISMTPSNAIKPDTAINRLKVIVQGNQMAFYVNDQWLNTITDSTLAKGQVGLYGESSDPNSQVAFKNVRISKINRPLTLPRGVPTVPMAVGSATPNTPETTLVLNQDFKSACGLPVSETDQAAFKCEGGEYTILSKIGNNSWWQTYKDPFDNVIIETEAHSVMSTPWANYGLIVRDSNDQTSLYLFEIVSNGQYGVLRYARPNFVWLVPLTPSNAIKPGTAVNRLKAIAQGNQLAFYVNDQWLNTVTDATLSQGTVGFFMGTNDPNSKAAFANARIWKINRPLNLPAGIPTVKP